MDNVKKGYNEACNKANEEKKGEGESKTLSPEEAILPSGDAPPDGSTSLEPSEQLPALRPTNEVTIATGENSLNSAWSSFVAGTKSVFNKVTETVGNAYIELTDKPTGGELVTAKVLGTLPDVYKEFPLRRHPVEGFTEGECQAFVERMSEYFRKRPRFKLDESMLNSMEVLFSQRHVVYHIGLSVLFENRTISSGWKAYERENLPNTATVNQDNVRPWDIVFEPHQIFKNRESTVLVFDSLLTNQCGSCNGHGIQTCDNCKGQGEHRCDTCAGRGEKRCDSCRGTGRETCVNSARGVCPACSGVGWKRCFWCSGSGIRTCIYCGGGGKVTCSDCKGSGHRLYYVAVTQTLKTASKVAFIPDANIPLKVFKKLDPKKDIQRVTKLDLNSTASGEVRQFFGDHFSDGNEFIVQELNTWFEGFRRSAGNDDSLTTHRLEMVVSQNVVNYVQYKLDNGRYDVWLYGKRQTPFEAMNPMSE